MAGWYTPLHIAAERGTAVVVDLLLKYDADVNATARLHDHVGLTPLHVASQHGHSEIVTMLVSAGSCIEAVRSFGSRSRITALHLAAENGYLVTARALVDLGHKRTRFSGFHCATPCRTVRIPRGCSGFNCGWCGHTCQNSCWH